MHFYSIGFFGAQNIGDELLSAAVVHRLRARWPDSRISVSTDSSAVSAHYADISADFVEGTAPLPGYLLSLRTHLLVAGKADLSIIGGGGLIADRYYRGALLRYAADAAWAVAFGGRFVLAGVGALDIRRGWLRPIARFLCRSAAAANCRDPESARRVGTYGGRDDVSVGPDLANMLLSDLCSSPAATGPTENYVLVNVREVPPIPRESFGRLCERLLDTFDSIVLLGAEPGESEFLEEIVAGWRPRERQRVRIVIPRTLREAVRLIEGARLVIAERFHVNLIAVYAGRPLLSVAYEEKVANLARDLGNGHCSVAIDELGPALIESVRNLRQPDWTSLTRRWTRESTAAFDRVVDAGLSAPRPTSIMRIVALSIALGILAFTLIRTNVAIGGRLVRRLWRTLPRRSRAPIEYRAGDSAE